jgi:hypothetical protein
MYPEGVSPLAGDSSVVIATVPKVAQCDFVDAALRAKANCPISRSLNANISMRATLSERDETGPGLFRKK